jgi:5-methylcytosine-specific restriction protein A
MPTKPKRPCNVCKRRIPSGESYCAKCKPPAKIQSKAHRERYDSTWAKISKAYRLEHPWCEVDGCGSPAAMVHHIVPLSEGGTNEPENLASMCYFCHNKIPKGKGI